MTAPFRSQSSHYASRLFSRRLLDLRVQLVALSSTGEHFIVHGWTRDLSRTGAGVTLTRELTSGTEVVLCMRLPSSGELLCLRALITRRQGFRAGLQFIEPSAKQRLLLSELCCA